MKYTISLQVNDNKETVILGNMNVEQHSCFEIAEKKLTFFMLLQMHL